MELTVKYRGQEKKINIQKEKIKAEDILKALGLSSEYAFVVKNGEVIGENEEVSPEDQIKVINAISGG
ncbi:MAG: MoaD/ThiS family protein [Aquificae bacterium]|nr:MoaD/ThiS family protein [Aquificota bacterium]